MIEGTGGTMAVHIHSREEALEVAAYYVNLGYENGGIVPSNKPENYPYIAFYKSGKKFTAWASPSFEMKEIIEFSDWECEVNGFNDFAIESADIVQTLFA